MLSFLTQISKHILDIIKQLISKTSVKHLHFFLFFFFMKETGEGDRELVIKQLISILPDVGTDFRC